MQNRVLHMKNVSFSYQEQPILQNVNLDINEGEAIGIIGPNGGGKTTLLKLIMGFLKPNKGTIEVCRNSLAYVPQNLQFDRQFPLSLFELVLMGRLKQLPWYGWYKKSDIEIALHALDHVGLTSFKHHPFGALSGGQMQRGLIARALASEPKLLLLDEPTASVDAQAQTEIYELLAQLSNQVTMLMVTHDLKTAIDAVDRLICVQGTTIPLSREEVCEHYALGLYHPPLLQLKGR